MKIAYNPSGLSALSTTSDAVKSNDIIFDIPGLAIWARGEKFDGRYHDIFTKATSSTSTGVSGLVPAPSYTSTNVRFLREDGTWEVPTDSHYTTHLYVGTTNTNSSGTTTNGNTYIKLYDDTTKRELYKISGTNGTTVSSDTNGNIIINSPTLTWDNITNKPSLSLSDHTHNLLTWNISDNANRNQNTEPADYNKIFKFVGIKTASYLGLNDVGTFVSLFGWRGYSDATGPYSWELASDNKLRIHVRSSKSNKTEWETWNTLAYVSDIPSLGITVSGTGNGISDLSVSNHTITITKDNFAKEVHTHSTNDITSLSEYTKATTASDLATDDSLNEALGKLEFKSDYAYDFIVSTMSNDNDDNDVIDRLKEVFDVLKDLSETDVLSTIIGNYLPLSGGIMKGSVLVDTNNTYDIGTSSKKWKNIYATTFNGDLSGDIVSRTPKLCKANEHDEISIVENSNSSIKTNIPNNISLSAIRKAIDFKWYETHWLIGNIRGGGENTSGFGITYGNDTLCFRVTTSDCYVGSNIILHTGNYTDYTVKKDGTGASGNWNINILGNASSADKVNNNLVITFNSGTTEDTDKFTFDGSVAKNININLYDTISKEIIFSSMSTDWVHSGIAFKDGASSTVSYGITDKLNGEGSYLIQLSNGTGMWTGYFTLRYTSNPPNGKEIADEIILQGGDSTTYERPYLRTINMPNNIISLLFAYSSSVSGNHAWTVKFRRLI